MSHAIVLALAEQHKEKCLLAARWNEVEPLPPLPPYLQPAKPVPFRTDGGDGK